MTIEKEAPGIWIACCDTCGDRLELDTDPDDEFVEAVAEIKEKGWRVHKPETIKFPGDYGSRSAKVTYWTHSCPDCKRNPLDRPVNVR